MLEEEEPSGHILRGSPAGLSLTFSNTVKHILWHICISSYRPSLSGSNPATNLISAGHRSVSAPPTLPRSSAWPWFIPEHLTLKHDGSADTKKNSVQLSHMSDRPSDLWHLNNDSNVLFLRKGILWSWRTARSFCKTARATNATSHDRRLTPRAVLFLSVRAEPSTARGAQAGNRFTHLNLELLVTPLEGLQGEAEL